MLTDTIEDLVAQAQREAQSVRVEVANATRASDAYEALMHASNLTYTAHDLAQAAVDNARLWGMSWSEIGAAFSVSKQAAQQRWGHA